MPYSNIRTVWVDRFEGYSDMVNPSDSPKITSEELNVKTKFGRILGRGGMSKFGGISAASSGDIIGLFSYRQADGTHELLRLLPAALEHYTGGAWADVSGAALNGLVSSQPQYTVIDDTLVFTNGQNKPRKFTSGPSAEIATGTSPYSKGIASYLGFLFLTNVSLNGSFTDVFDGHRMAYYADSWDSTWEECLNNTITLDETPGAWINSLVIGKTLFAVKSDGVIAIQHVGGNNRFRQDALPIEVGSNAPLSWAVVYPAAGSPGSMAFGLGNDGIIYRIHPSGIEPISYDRLPKLIPNTRSLNKLNYARGLIDSEDDAYWLFFDRTGLSNQLLDSYAYYNFRSRSFDHGRLSIPIISCVPHKTTDNAEESLIVSTPTLVETFDSTSTTDDGNPISRYWTSGWQRLGEQGWISGVRLVFSKARRARVRASVAFDNDETYHFPQSFALTTGHPQEQVVDISYRFPTPRWGHSLKIKLQFYHDHSIAITELERMGIEVTNILPVSVTGRREAEGLRS